MRARRYSPQRTEACTGALADILDGEAFSPDSLFEIKIQDDRVVRGRAHPLDMLFDTRSDFGFGSSRGRYRVVKKLNSKRAKQKAAKAARKRSRSQS